MQTSFLLTLLDFIKPKRQFLEWCHTKDINWFFRKPGHVFGTHCSLFQWNVSIWFLKRVIVVDYQSFFLLYARNITTAAIFLNLHSRKFVQTTSFRPSHSSKASIFLDIFSSYGLGIGWHIWDHRAGILGWG